MTPPIARYDPKNPDGVALAYQIAHEFAAQDVHGENLQEIYSLVSAEAHRVVQEHRKSAEGTELPLADAMARAVPSPIEIAKLGIFPSAWPKAVSLSIVARRSPAQGGVGLIRPDVLHTFQDIVYQILSSNKLQFADDRILADFINQITPEQLEIALTTNFKGLDIDHRTRLEALIREVWTHPEAGPQLKALAVQEALMRKIL